MGAGGAARRAASWVHREAAVRIAAGDGGAGGAGGAERREEAARGAGFPAAIDRAIRTARVRAGDARDPGEAEDAPGPGVDGLSRDRAAPDPPESEVRAPPGALLARAVERIAILVGQGAVPSMTLRLGVGMEVRLEQAGRGVDVELRFVRGLSPLAEGELPGLVAALRARGVRVTRAAAGRAGRGRPSLTARRSSDTTAGVSGTVAKW
jgi:hypothetical protein